MEETVYKIALAGLLHDIGKFAERALADSPQPLASKGFHPKTEFIENNRGLFQPCFDGRYTHRHAVYTAAFLDDLEKILPPDFRKDNWGLGEPLINLAAAHHKPEKPLEWIITVADRLSSGIDRDRFKDYDRQDFDLSGYKKTRLKPVFEEIELPENEQARKPVTSGKPATSDYCYPLQALTAQTIFPGIKETVMPPDREKAGKEYRKLFENFVFSLEKLAHPQHMPLWFEHFESLFQIFTSQIPATTVGPYIHDISLYDHSRTASAIASALYLYHQATDSVEVERIKDYDIPKFRLIQGEFYGIQDFIFAQGGKTARAAAKILRGRSFYQQFSI